MPHPTPTPARSYFDPEVVAKLHGLTLRARHIVEGYMTGLHRSPYRGSSVEFVEHRQYSPGDELRYVDWKVFGRSDRYYVKQYEEETNLICHLLVDASESMAYQGRGSSLTKFAYAQCLAATLAHIVLRQQDQVGLTMYNSSIVRDARPSGRPSSWRKLVEMLEQTNPTGDNSTTEVFHELADRWKQRSLVVILSDLLEPSTEVLPGLARFRHANHDVAVLQILDRDEVDFPFDSEMNFAGLEGLPTARVNARRLRKAYLKELQAVQSEMRSRCGAQRIDYLNVVTDEPFDQVLRRFFHARDHSRPHTQTYE